MHLVKINLCDGHFIPGVLEVIFENVEIAFVHFIDQMHGQVVEIILDRMGAFRSVPL